MLWRRANLKLTLPVTVLIAEKGELLDAIKISEFVEACGNPNLRSRTISNDNSSLMSDNHT